jgi:hypothetical protein
MQRSEFPARIASDAPGGPNPPFQRLAPHLLNGLTLGVTAMTGAGEITSDSLAQYLRKVFSTSTPHEQMPEFQASAGPAIIFPRPTPQSRAMFDALLGYGEDREPMNPSADPEPSPLFGGGLRFTRKAAEDEVCLNVRNYA